MLEAKWDTFYLIFTSVYEHTPDLFRQTKRLTKMISSDEPMGFHITVPFARTLNREILRVLETVNHEIR